MLIPLLLAMYVFVMASYRTLYIVNRLPPKGLAFWVLMWLGSCCFAGALVVGTMIVRWFMGLELMPWTWT